MRSHKSWKKVYGVFALITKGERNGLPLYDFESQFQTPTPTD